MKPGARLCCTIALAAALGCGTAAREQVLGSWQSDKQATLAEVDRSARVTPAQRAWLEENLGQLIVEYTRERVTATLPDWQDSGPYRVVGEGSNWVEVQRTDPELEPAPVHRVYVDGDRMWVRVDPLGFDEIFRRMR